MPSTAPRAGRDLETRAGGPPSSSRGIGNPSLPGNAGVPPALPCPVAELRSACGRDARAPRAPRSRCRKESRMPSTAPRAGRALQTRAGGPPSSSRGIGNPSLPGSAGVPPALQCPVADLRSACGRDARAPRRPRFRCRKESRMPSTAPRAGRDRQRRAGGPPSSFPGNRESIFTWERGRPARIVMSGSGSLVRLRAGRPRSQEAP